MGKEILSLNIDKIHTTKMGMDRIRKNIKLNKEDVILFCKEKILDKDSNVYRKGKNWYVHCNDIVITINANSYTIITAHFKNKE